MTDVEILVAGAGPAGLLTAAYLADRYRVGVIDSSTIGQTTKYWVTSESRLARHGLSDCIQHRATAALLGTFLGPRILVPGDFVVVDDERFLRILIERCRARGVIFVDQCTLLNFRWTKGNIEAYTTGGRCNTRLIVDATGGLSQIAATFQLVKLDGFYIVYGALLRGIALQTQDIVLAYVDHLGDPAPILEVVPCGVDTAYCVIFICSQQLRPPESLASAFQAHCQHNPFFRISDHTEMTSSRVGAIPIGTIRRRHLPGILSIGEAGLVQPPLIGTAFNEILEYSKSICAHVSHVLQSESVFPKMPTYQYPLIKHTQDRLQLLIARRFLHGNVETFDRLVRAMCKLPPAMVYNFCSETLTWPQLLHLVTRYLSLGMLPRRWRY